MSVSFCVVCINSRRYVCCSECDVVSNECNEPTSCLVKPIGAHCSEVMYFWCFGFRGGLGFLNCGDVCMCVVNKQFELLEFVMSRPIPSSNHTYTKSTPKHIHHHYAPSVTSTHTTHIISSTASTYAPHCHPWICGQTPPGRLHCWLDGRRSWLVDHKRENWTPPTSKGHGGG